MKAMHRHTNPDTLWQAAGGDLDTFRHLSGMFCQLAPAYLATMREARAQGCTEDMAVACHALLGMTVLMGADSLSALLRALEYETRERRALPDLAPIEALLSAVMEEAAYNALHYEGGSAP